jgi:prepilin-type N-terminal cleavage/methylation domain-containing protein
MNQVRGFSLVEAMVALVILSIIFAAVWEWFGVAVSSTKKIERAIAYPEVFELFTNRMQHTSLETQRDGTFTFGEFEVRWQAAPKRLSSSEIINRQRSWEVGLFNIRAQIIHQGVEVAQFSTQQVSYWQDENDIRSIFGNR